MEVTTKSIVYGFIYIIIKQQKIGYYKLLSTLNQSQSHTGKHKCRIVKTQRQKNYTTKLTRLTYIYSYLA